MLTVNTAKCFFSANITIQHNTINYNILQFSGTKPLRRLKAQKGKMKLTIGCKN